MTFASDQLFSRFQIRKSRSQKEAFRSWLVSTLRGYGYSVQVESSGFPIKSSNVIVGSPENASVVFTAHYDTCAVLPFPNFITPRNPLLYLLYQFLVVILMLVLAIGAEMLLLLCWEDCPLWLAIAVVYVVLGFCIWWMLAGPANRHTANDNTSGVITLLEIALTLPAEQREHTAFVFFDNEEKGLLGSSQFKKAHGKALSRTLLINFDCVSDGNHIHFYPNQKLKGNSSLTALLENHYTSRGKKQVEVIRGFGFYPSDQKAFPYGVGAAAMRKSRVGYWLGRIHTNRDTVFDRENIELLRAGSLSLVAAMQNKEEICP